MIGRRLLTLSVLTLVFSALLIAARSAQAQTETVLYNFSGGPIGPDGANPASSLTSDGAGNFYGTTSDGGPSGYGTVFELSPNGSGGWNETVLHSFTDGADGGNPWASSLMSDSVGNLYGTASYGGSDGKGVVFELSLEGGIWTETVLYSFSGGADGYNPASGVIIDSAGNLYGTTYQGGAYGTGTVFELTPAGGGWSEKVIYSGSYPFYAGLIMDTAGNIFGVSTSTVFELSPNGNGGWNPTMIHTFIGAPKDGGNAAGTPVLDKAGNLYGTTTSGGAKNFGTVWKLSPGKKAWKEKILYSFKGGPKDGNGPSAGIVFGGTGNVYGTTTGGGSFACSNGCGTVFELVAPVGKGSYKEKILWKFNGTDGYLPQASLILDNEGNLYGTSYFGGSGGNCQQGCGVVFKMTP